MTCERLATTFPGLELRWTAREGARQLAAAYQAAGMTRERFEGPTYKRLGEIRRLLADGRLGPDLRWRTSAA